MFQPLVSVVIPTYNRPVFLENAIRSVVNQTYPKLEIIVVDDSSEMDIYDSVIKKFKDFEIEYIKLSTRCYANNARNIGIDKAHGEFIAFLDDDDWWFPQKIEKQINIFKIDSEIRAVYCGMMSFDIDARRFLHIAKRNYPHGYLFRKLLIRDVTAGTSSWVVHQSCFKIVGKFDEKLKARQDWDMWIRLSKYFKIGCVPETLVVAGEHRLPRVRNDFRHSLDAYVHIYRKYKPYRLKYGLSTELNAKSEFYFNIGTLMYMHHVSIIQIITTHIVGIACYPKNLRNYVGLLKVFIPEVIKRLIRIMIYKNKE